jgi:putative ABC transport system permease protein
VTKVALRGLAARKLRAFTTTLAVFLGVALIAGTYVLTDTINHSFDDIFQESLKGTDVAITPSTAVDTGDSQPQPPAFPASLLDRVRRVDGVEAAAGSIFTAERFVDRKGDPIGNSFAPNFVSSVLPKRFETLTYVKGRAPRTAAETALDTQTADRGHLGIRGRLYIAGEEAVHPYRIVGLTRLGETSFGGAGIAQLTLPEAQRVTGKVGKFDQISVAAADGVSDTELKQRIQRVMPSYVQVETGKEAAKRQSENIASDLSFLKIALLVFAGVSLFVGAFLIFNTFSITVAQRIREFGMLRTLGATRRQVLGSVILEAAVIGATGALTGLAGGIGVANGLNALFKAFQIDLPNTGMVLATRTVVVSLLVGLLVTVVSSLSPALRATRVSPMAALHEAELPDSRQRGRVYLAVSLFLSVGGLVLTSIGLFAGIESSSAAAGLIGGGAVAVLLGVSLFSPRLVKPLAAVVGEPIERLRGITGRLARENALRKPGRTAATAAALMIGLAVVVFVTTFAAGINDSVAKAIDRNFQGDLVMQNLDGFSPIPRRAGQEAARVPGVQTVSSLSSGGGELQKPRDKIRVSGVDPLTVDQVLRLDWKKGSPSTLRKLGPREAVVDDAWAKSRGIGLGDTLRIRTPIQKTAVYTVRGAVKDNADLVGDVLVPERSLAALFGVTAPSTTFIKLRPGANPAAVKKRVSDVVEKRFPVVEVLNQQELKDKQKQQINQLVALIYALLSLAVIVSLFGIVNTLALSIHERTRELGMLRAVGMSRRQVKRMIRYEAVITAVIGALLGTILGVIFAALISQPLADQGFTLSYPVPTLVVLLILAALAGVVAAIGPARRAARLNVLEALAYE